MSEGTSGNDELKKHRNTAIPPHESKLDDLTEKESAEAMKNSGKSAIILFLIALAVPPVAPFFIVAGIISGIGAFSFTAKHAEAERYNEYRDKVIEDQKG